MKRKFEELTWLEARNTSRDGYPENPADGWIYYDTEKEDHIIFNRDTGWEPFYMFSNKLVACAPGQHVIAAREPVVWFAEQMEGKLQENDHRSGWESCDTKWLLRRVSDERMELKRAIDKGDIKNIIEECADIANFAMMIADKARIKLRVGLRLKEKG